MQLISALSQTHLVLPKATEGCCMAVRMCAEHRIDIIDSIALSEAETDAPCSTHSSVIESKVQENNAGLRAFQMYIRSFETILK